MTIRLASGEAAANAARLAALCPSLEHGPSGTIAPEEIRAVAGIVSRHLKVARRLPADLHTPLDICREPGRSGFAGALAAHSRQAGVSPRLIVFVV